MLTPQTWAFALLVVISLSALLSYNYPLNGFTIRMKIGGSNVLAFLCGTLFLPLLKRVVARSIRVSNKDDTEGASLYGLEHGRLHLDVSTPMWMNMGYWAAVEQDSEDENESDKGKSKPQNRSKSKKMAHACRDLLIEVFDTAGFSMKRNTDELAKGERKKKSLLDLGFGCGDQTVCLSSNAPFRSLFEGWPDSQKVCPQFDQYVGITLDEKQYRFASERIRKYGVENMRQDHTENQTMRSSNIKLFCSDAAKPVSWSKELKESITNAIDATQERWVLALDTAYHFSPSRWPLIEHVHRNLHASFMAFDLCISPTATLKQRILLQIITSLMGAPWANFCTPADYRKRLIEIGYQDSQITVKDISEAVFEPLSTFLEEQDCKLRTIGLGLGPFNVARLMFRWWAKSGVVRGVIVVAKRVEDE